MDSRIISGGLIALLGLVLACADTRSSNPFDSGSSDGATSGMSSGSASDDESETGAADGTMGSVGGTTGPGSDADDGGPKLDVQAPDGGGAIGCDDPDGNCPCSAVDVLFVIDNSGSMCTFQDGLAQAFPTFVDAMYEALPENTDLHLAITTSGFSLGGSHSENNCVAQESQATIDEYFVPPTEGMVDGNGLQGRLLEWEGKRYYEANTGDLAGKAALTDWFSGAAVCTPGTNAAYDFLAALGSEPVWGDIHSGNIINPDITSYTEVVGNAFAEVVAQTCETIPPVG